MNFLCVCLYMLGVAYPCPAGFLAPSLGSRSSHHAPASCDPTDFNLTAPGRCEASEVLSSLKRKLDTAAQTSLGYVFDGGVPFHPHNRKHLAFLLNTPTNNIGDPFENGHFNLNTKEAEKQVLDYYARLWHAQTPQHPTEPNSYWGYITTMGSTEGNLYSLWNARDYLAGRPLLLPENAVSSQSVVPLQCPQSHSSWSNTPSPAGCTAVAFFSEETHYSVIKACKVLQIPTFGDIGRQLFPGQCPLSTTNGSWPDLVPSTGGSYGPGTIDVDSLITLLEFFIAKGYPPVVVLTVGTTFKGAYDDVEEAGTRMIALLARYGVTDRTVKVNGHTAQRAGYWVHVDGALGASFLPYMRTAHKDGLLKQQTGATVEPPRFDFELPWVASMVTSGHKWPSNPLPCAVYMSKNRFRLKPPSRPEYIGGADTTFSGSRSGVSPVVWWDNLAKQSHQTLIWSAVTCVAVAKYAEASLIALGEQLGLDLWVSHPSELSLSVLFKRTHDDITKKYTLSPNSYGPRSYVHVVAMPHVTYMLIDELMEDLRNHPDPFPSQFSL